MIVPAVTLVLALGLTAVQCGAIQVGLADASADAARMLGRGDPPGRAEARVAAVQPGASMSVQRGGALVCVEATASGPRGGLGAALRFSARGCALDDTAGPGS
jgi:hypothetical protein